MVAATLRDADDAAWMQYADGLVEQGDARGELILAELRGEPACRDEERLLSPALLELAHYWRFTFRRTFIRMAWLGGPPEDPAPVEAVHALRQDPAAAMLDYLEVTTAPAILEAMLADPPPMRQLMVGSMREWLGPQRTSRARVAIHTLRELWTHSANLPALWCGDFDLPELESLNMCITNDDAVFGTGSLFSRPPARLGSLRLATSRVRSAPLVTGLVRSPLAAQLRHLHLPLLDQEARGTLLESAGVFQRLERLRFTAFGVGVADAEVEADNAAFAAAFSGADVRVDWVHARAETAEQRPTTDAESRGPDGRVDAIGHFASRHPRRR